MKALKSWVALAQLAALCQILFGFLILPTMLHTGDSAIYDSMHDSTDRPRIERWHDGQVIFTSRVVGSFGVIVFIISTTAAFYAQKVAKDA